MTRALERLLSCCAVIALTACAEDERRSSSPFDHLAYRRVSSAPGFVSLRPLEIQMERGLAVRARVSAIGVDGKPLDLLELRSRNEEVFTVDLGPRLGEYVFHGARADRTFMDVFSDGQFEAEIPIEVIEQTP